MRSPEKVTVSLQASRRESEWENDALGGGGGCTATTSTTAAEEVAEVPLTDRTPLAAPSPSSSSSAFRLATETAAGEEHYYNILLHL